MPAEKKNEKKSPHVRYKRMADDAIALQILDIIERDEEVSQHKIKAQTGLATGLVHAYMRKIINKGWVKAKQVSARRWLYYLTPEGFVEKSRLTINYLQRTLSEYRQAHNLVQKHLQTCIENGWRRLVVAGDNDLAEISAININAMEGLFLAGVVADNGAGRWTVGGVDILHFESIDSLEYDRIMVCDIRFISWLRDKGVNEKDQPLILL